MNAVTFVTPALFLEGLLAGTFVGSMMLEQATNRLDLSDWLPFNRAKEVAYGSTMPIFFTLTLLSSIFAAVFGADRLHLIPAAVALGLAGVVTVRIHLPLNDTFKSWSRQDHPAHSKQMRDRWRRWNIARGALAISAFALTI